MESRNRINDKKLVKRFIMGEVFNTEQFIQNLWERENLQGINVRL